MKKNALLIVASSMLITACLGNPPRPLIKDNPIKADPDLIAYVKSKGWLDHNCRSGELSFTGFHSNRKFLQCVLVDAALLKPFDPEKPDHFGKDYDPEKYYRCRSKAKSPGDATCNIYKLVRDEPLPVWPYPDVPSIKWPDPPKEQVYYPGISPREYYANLCLKESGHFIYKTVDNVQGVYQVRPRYPERSVYMLDPYVMEDPYGFDISDGYRTVTRVMSLGYKFVESSVLYDPWNDVGRIWRQKHYHSSLFEPIEKGSRYFKYEREGEGSLNESLRKVQTDNLQSQYGYVWRGIKRPRDREMGIAGGELAIIDLKTNEILGLIRGFALSGMRRDGRVSWLTARRCALKRDAEKYGFDNFIKQVLKPALYNRASGKKMSALNNI